MGLLIRQIGERFDGATVAADGSSQATAAAITVSATHVTGADGTKGVVLPAATVGLMYFVGNGNDEYALKVYPATGGYIVSASSGKLTQNMPVTLPPSGLGLFYCEIADYWYAIVGKPWLGNNADFDIGTGRLATTGTLTAGHLDLLDNKAIHFGTGTDVIVTGNFSADSDWTKGAGWTIAGGVAVATGGISTTLTQTAAPLTSGRTYRVKYTVATCTAGTITATCGTQAGTARSSPGTYTEVIVANGTAFEFATAGFTGTIDDVSAELADVDMTWNGSNLEVRVAGDVDFTIAANTLTAASGSSIATNTISETTGGSGVTIDSLLIQDGCVDTNGTADAIILDADGDTTISSPTDDQIDVELNGADDFTFTADTFTALSGSTIKTNTLAETTTGAGVMCSSYFQSHGNAAVTATTGGGTTGLIPTGASFVTVTSDDANKQITLPAGTVGDIIQIYVGANGCELIAATAADKVNNVVVGTTNEAALVATTTYTCRYVGTNTWLMTGTTYLGAVEAPVVPDSL